MEALLQILFWGGLFFLMMRFGCGAHAKGHGHADEPGQTESPSTDKTDVRWVPPLKDTDPVCSKTVATDKAKSTVFDGKVYYFCSRDCREIFEARPDLYVGGGNPKHLEMEHSHA